VFHTRSEDRDTDLFQRLEQFVLDNYPNPRRIGCLHRDELEALLDDPGSLDLKDIRYMHIMECAECTRDLIGFREARRQKASLQRAVRLKRLAFALAACLVVVSGAVLISHRVHKPSVGVQVASSQVLSAKVDLFNVDTLRGGDVEAAPIQVTFLPAALVHVSVTLPRFSRSGAYEIRVSKDRDGAELVAMGKGAALESEGKLSVNVTLDLRRAKSGSYSLATVHDSDNVKYYYALQVLQVN
jgi:hypothetical protein